MKNDLQETSWFLAFSLISKDFQSHITKITLLSIKLSVLVSGMDFMMNVWKNMGMQMCGDTLLTFSITCRWQL